MPRIKDIGNDSQLTSGDKLLGTDVSGSTKNYTLGDISNFANAAILGFTTVTHSSNTHTIDLNAGENNYNVTAQNATNTIAFSNLAAADVGKAGNIIITNPGTVTSLAWAALPATAYTPGGAAISFDLTANKIAVLSYLVIASDKVLINYVGNFGAYPQ